MRSWVWNIADGALSGQAVAKVQGRENPVDSGLVDTETHRVQKDEQIPNKHLYIDGIMTGVIQKKQCNITPVCLIII